MMMHWMRWRKGADLLGISGFGFSLENLDNQSFSFQMQLPSCRGFAATT